MPAEQPQKTRADKRSARFGTDRDSPTELPEVVGVRNDITQVDGRQPWRTSDPGTPIQRYVLLERQFSVQQIVESFQ